MATQATQSSIVSAKGGVGKTTLTANLGVMLADLDKRVLLVDADIQLTLSRETIGVLERLSPMEDLGFSLGNLYGLIYRVGRTADAREISEALRAMCYGPSRRRIMILDTVIPATVAHSEEASIQQPVHRFELVRQGPTSSGLESMLNLIRALPIGLGEAAFPADNLPGSSKP